MKHLKRLLVGMIFLGGIVELAFGLEKIFLNPVLGKIFGIIFLLVFSYGMGVLWFEPVKTENAQK